MDTVCQVFDAALGISGQKNCNRPVGYVALQNRHQAEIDAFPLGFAYTRSQYEAMLEKLDCQPSDLVDIGDGGYVRKRDEAALDALIARHEAERSAARQDPEYVYQMFRYELSNHEYCLTWNVEPTLRACDMTLAEVKANPMWTEQLLRAEKDYLNSVPSWVSGWEDDA